MQRFCDTPPHQSCRPFSRYGRAGGHFISHRIGGTSVDRRQAVIAMPAPVSPGSTDDFATREWHMKGVFRLPRLGAIAVGMLLAATAAAQNKPAAPSGQAAVPHAQAPAIAEAADRLLKQVGVYIGSAEAFIFHADITFDHVLASGQKLQFAAADVVLERPGRLYVEWNGDLGDRGFWYDGKSVTLWDPATPFYASAAAPPEIDGMLG